MEHVLQDVRFGLRVLRRSPGFALAALICIALGVGVSTTIFSAVNGILLRPLPFPNSDELVIVHSRNLERGITGGRISYADYAVWRDGSHAFGELGLWLTNFPTVTGEGDPERIDGAQVSPNVFHILGVHPIVGRDFLPTDEQPGNDNSVMLSYGLWQRRYGGDPSVVGRTIELSGRPFQVLGITPPGFSFPEGVQMWTPLGVNTPRARHDDRFFTGAIGRLKKGASVMQAKAELGGLSKRLQSEFPQESKGWEADAVSLRDDLVGVLRRPVLIFQSAALLVLLIACANVANLMLARGAAREREMAVRSAIGANRGRIFTQVVTESVVVAFAGGAIGAFIAFAGVRLLSLAFPDGVPSYISLSIDGTVLFFTILLTLLTGLLFGLTPALRASRVQLTTTLREGDRGIGSAPIGRLIRSSLILAEVALSLVLMISATLLVRSDLTLEHELGFDPRGVLSVRIPIPYPKYVDARRDEFYDTLFARIRALPGVESVGSAPTGIPLISATAYGRQPVEIEGASTAIDDQAGAIVHDVTMDFLSTLGVPLVRGRGFRKSDLDSPEPSAVINQTFARRYFSTQDPVGKRVKLGKELVNVIGVAPDFRQERPPQPIAPAMYLYHRFYPGGQTLVIRTALADPVSLVPSIRSIVRELDPGLVVYMVQTLDQAVSRGLWRQRLQARVLGIFAGLAAVLAVFGIYGVISYTIEQRTHEVGLRMALGATQQDVIVLVIRQGAGLTLAGVGLGIVVALALTRFLAGLLYGVAPTDAVTFILVSLVLALVGLLAALIPARRAARVDPLIALRSE